MYETETKKKKDKARNRYTDRKREREGMEKKMKKIMLSANISKLF